MRAPILVTAIDGHDVRRRNLILVHIYVYYIQTNFPGVSVSLVLNPPTYCILLCNQTYHT